MLYSERISVRDNGTVAFNPY